MSNLCVLINSLTIGGAEKLAVTLSDEYKKNGINIIFVCLEKNNFYQTAGNSIQYLSNFSGENENFVTKFFYLLIYAFRLKKILRDNGISIVQSHIYRANYVNVLARLLGSPHKTQLVNHGIVSRYQNEGLAGRINLFLIKYLYSKADQLVFPSQGMMEDLDGLGYFDCDKVVINNPFDLAMILEQKNAPVENGNFYFDPAKKYLVAAGRLEKVKRYFDIIEAVRLLRESAHDVDLILLGDGPEEEYLKELVGRYGMEGCVHFPGRVTNPFKYIFRADLLVSSSEFEGFSNVIVEALVCGTPVVSTDCASGPREILAPGSSRGRLTSGHSELAEFGALVPVGDPSTMAKAIGDLLSDARMMKKYSDRGEVRARDFDKKVIAAQYIKCLKTLKAE